MRRVRWLTAIGTAVALAALAACASSDALTLGDTTVPGGTTAQLCSGAGGTSLIQTETDTGYDYVVPAGGGAITSWSFNTTGATVGAPYELVVVRPMGGAYTVIGADSELVPATPPLIQTYTLSAPIPVQAGDLLGVFLSSTSAVDCFWLGGSLTTSDVFIPVDGTPVVGATLTTPSPPAPERVLNLSVNLVQSEDVALTQQLLPNSISVGGSSAFLLSVTSAGPGALPVTVTDTVPAGLTVDSVSAGNGSCSVNGQAVSCVVPGAPASIAVIVSGKSAGAYANTATASTQVTDPNQTNNSASATLEVTAAGAVAPQLHLAALAKLPVAEAKFVIRALGCKVGKITHRTSKSIRKGDVISTSPRRGAAVTAGQKIAIVVSSGKPKKKRHTSL
jgi:Domain of unknown function DUF11/PASTA domain